MAWTDPRTWTVGEIVTKAIMDAAVKMNLRYLKGQDGPPTIQSGLTIDNSLGSERLLLPLLSTAECSTVLNAAGEVAYDEATNRIKMYGATLNSVVTTADVDDTPANNATTDPISSNWAFDHLATLTTAGDIPYATGAGVWARKAIGTATQYFRVNSGATAPEWGTGYLATIVRKTADETVNNSTDLQNDDHLLLAILANEVWAGTIYIKQNSSEVADIQFALIVPNGAVMIIKFIGQTVAGALGIVTKTDATPIICGGLALEMLNTFEFIVANGGNAGNIQLQWAQNTAEASNTIVRANSYIVAYKLA